MPIIVPFLVGVAKVGGTLAARQIARRLAKRAAKKGIEIVPRARQKPGFPRQPKVEGLPQAATRQRLRESRRRSVREFKQRQQNEEIFRREADAASKAERTFQEGLDREMKSLLKGVQKEMLRASIITGRGRPTRAMRDFNKAVTRETLKLLKGGGGGGF